LPWSDRRAFADLMLSREMQSYRAALADSCPVVFDRAVRGLPVPPLVEPASQIFRYHHRVIIAPP
jgi:predicted ATPase